MFFEITFTETVRIDPEKLCGDVESRIKEELRATTVNKIKQGKGLILDIIEVFDIPNCGRISHRTGDASFAVKCKALTFYPHNGQVVDAVVQNIKDGYLICTAGFIKILVQMHLNTDFVYDSVSSSYKCENLNKVIDNNSIVRVKINKVTYSDSGQEKFNAMGTINGKGLGIRD